MNKTVLAAQWLHAAERELEAKFQGDLALSLRWAEIRKQALALYNSTN